MSLRPDNRGEIITNPRTKKCFYVSKTKFHKPGQPRWLGPMESEEAKALQKEEKDIPLSPLK